MASSMNERKVMEGLQLVKEAEKCLQTNWLKWKPDYDSAADKFTKAGTSFKVGKSYDQAKDAFLKAADVHMKNHSLYHSGKAMEQAGMMLKELKKIDEAAELLNRAGALFLQNGTSDTAAMVLIKAAKMCEGTNQTKAVELYLEAAELRETDDKIREAAEPYNKATQLLIKQRKFEEVVNSLTKQLELYARIENSAMQYKIILGLTIVHLYQDDFVAADKCFKDAFDVPGFGTSDEAEAIENLLEAYDQSDAEAITTVASKPLFRHLDNELSKLARDLRPSDEFNISQRTTELRVISSDVTKLKIDERQPASKANQEPAAPQFIDDDEENPLGSEDVEVSRVPSDEPRVPSDEPTTEETELPSTTGNEDIPATDKSSATPKSGEAMGVPVGGTDEEDDLEGEGGLC